MFRYAYQVTVDDAVLVQRNEKLMATKVINVSSLMMQGNCICSLSFTVAQKLINFKNQNAGRTVIYIPTLSSLKYHRRNLKKCTMSFCSGMYVPLTTEGNIIVDTVLASCYASFDHDLAHIGMKPIQWFPELLQWVLGEDGRLATYVGTAKQLGRLILSFGQFWQ